MSVYYINTYFQIPIRKAIVSLGNYYDMVSRFVLISSVPIPCYSNMAVLIEASYKVKLVFYLNSI